MNPTQLILFMFICLPGFFQAQVNDSIYIQFSYNQSQKQDSLTLFAANGWYKSPLAGKKNKSLDHYQLIIPAQQSLERVLTITSLAHEIRQPIDYTYPRQYRNEPVDKKPAPDTILREEFFSGILDGIYISPPDTLLRDFEKDHPLIFDSVNKTQEAYRNQQIQPFVTDLFQPFYFSKTEVTNDEYRQFINWVRDSIAMRMIYLDHPEDKEALKLLNINKKEAASVDLFMREKALEKYGLNYSYKIDYDNPVVIALTMDMYYQQPERFYKRRSMDESKFIYKTSRGENIAVFPDSASSLDLYALHPMYDYYPVLGLNYQQAMAYCEWYQRKMNETLAKEGYRAEVRIPTLFHYEMAVKSNLEPLGKHNVENLPNDAYHLYERRASENFYFLKKVNSNDFNELSFSPGKGRDSQGAWRYNNWLRSNQGFPIYFLNGNVSEFCSTPVTAEMIRYYKLQFPETDFKDQVLVLGSNYREDVIDLKGNQKNALFYKRIVPKTKAAPYQGLRMVVYLHKMN